MDINIKVSLDVENIRSLMSEFVSLLKGKRECSHDEQIVKTKPEPSKIDIASPHSTKTCELCGKEFTAKRRDQIVCEDNVCRRIFHSWKVYNIQHDKKLTLSEYVEYRENKKKRRRSAVHQSNPTRSIPKKTVEASIEKTCPICGSLFRPFVADQCYCSKCMQHYGDECSQVEKELIEKRLAEQEARRVKFRVCPRCGTNFEAKHGDEFFCPRCTAKATNLSKLAKPKTE